MISAGVSSTFKRNNGKDVGVADVHATLLHALGIDTFKELMTPVGRPMGLTDGILVPELMTPA